MTLPDKSQISNSGNGGNSRKTSNGETTDVEQDIFDNASKFWDFNANILNSIPGVKPVGDAVIWGGSKAAPLFGPLVPATRPNGP